MENINHFIERAIGDSSICIKYSNLMEDDESFIHSNFCDKIEESVLLRLIEKSKDNLNLQRFLSALSICFYRDEITLKVFSALSRYKGKYRKSILIGLAHCDLSYYQLVVLNKKKIDEALIKLINLFFKYDCFSEHDLQAIFIPWHGKIPKYILEGFSEDNQQKTLSSVMEKMPGKPVM